MILQKKTNRVITEPHCFAKGATATPGKNGGITLTLQWVRWSLKSPFQWLFTKPFIQAQVKGNIKAPRYWPLCGEFTGDRWIPRTMGQWRGKCFHLMTSPWSYPFITANSGLHNPLASTMSSLRFPWRAGSQRNLSSTHSCKDDITSEYTNWISVVNPL